MHSLPQLIVGLVISLLMISGAFGADVRHLINDQDSIDGIQSQRICQNFSVTDGRGVCLGTAATPSIGGSLQADGSFKANERGYQIVSDFLDRRIDRDGLDKIFRDDSFQSASAILRIRANYGIHTLDFVPHHVMGAAKLTNPSLPEINIAAIRQSVYRYTLSDYSELPLPKTKIFYFGSLAYSQRQQLFTSLDLLTAAVTPLIDELKIENKNLLTGDVGSTAQFELTKNHAIDFGVAAYNLGIHYPCAACELRAVDIERNQLLYTAIRGGYHMDLSFGRFFFGVVLPFGGYLSEYRELETAAGMLYEIGTLRSYFSFSPAMRSFGFAFKSDLFLLGIQYTDEKQDNSLQLKRERHTYVHGSYFL